MNKPHLYKQAGVHYCSDGRWLGWGPTAKKAYGKWKHRNAGASCVHNQPTALQRRRAHIDPSPSHP